VINEDFVEAGQGFGTHPHRDMEILTWILEGSLQHKDSMGNGSLIQPGEMQYMSAGTGVAHSEFNPSKSERVHLLQIWIQPNEHGAKPRYGQKDFTKALASGRPVLVASSDGKNDSIAIRQDARLFVARAKNENEWMVDLAPGRSAWIQMARGAARVNDRPLAQGDGAAVEGERKLTIQPDDGSELLLFDLP
jgi:redox-sensitive bicupin YhaK (pirin superfamily)